MQVTPAALTRKTKRTQSKISRNPGLLAGGVGDTLCFQASHFFQVKKNNIRPLDRNSVHRICTAQVILDLAASIKELVENSLDAGAKIIGSPCVFVLFCALCALGTKICVSRAFILADIFSTDIKLKLNDSGECDLSISDDGCGIEPDNFSHLGSKFLHTFIQTL